MIHAVRLPQMHELMDAGVVVRRYVEVGAAFRARQKLFDVRVDLGGAVAADCPPIFFFRIMSSEPGVVRSLPEEGAQVAVGAVVALVSTDAAEPLGEPERDARTYTLGVDVDPFRELFG